MSATFKNSKKKLSQLEFRKFMNEHKSKQNDVKKIDSPLAKYNDQGQLTCVLCKTTVRTESVWTVHINAKIHKQNVEIAKKLKERTNNFTTPLKRPLTPTDDVPEKKIKGILKKFNNFGPDLISINNANINSSILNNFLESMDTQTTSQISSKKYFDRKFEIIETEGELEKGNKLPEGFFDDPKLDAKVRNQEYKDPIEEEWEKFVKVIKEADNESNAIIAEDQEEATSERQIDEIDEQMKNLSRVLDLEKQKVKIVSICSETENPEKNEVEDGQKEDFDEFLDWRAKKSFR